MRKIIYVLLCTLMCLSLPMTACAESGDYHWAISKDLKTLYLGPDEFTDPNNEIYVDTGNFDPDSNCSYLMPWSKNIVVDGKAYNTTMTIEQVVVEPGMKPKSITRWFWEFKKLQEVDLTNLDTSELVYMQETFASCDSLESINVSNFNTEKIQLVAACFYDLPKLKELNLSSFTIGEDVDIIDTSGFFIDNLPSLRSLKLPKVIKTSFPSPEFLKWLDENGNIIDVITSKDAGKTLSWVNGYDLVVNNTLVSEQNCNDVLGDEKVSYDPNAQTLTLDNATIDTFYCDAHNDDYALIYTCHSLNINLIGDNKLILPNVDAEDDFVCGIHLPMAIDDGLYSLDFNGDKLSIEGAENITNRGIMAYNSYSTITNNANIVIDIAGEYARGIDSLGDFVNKGTLDVKVTGNNSWGICLDHENFYNDGFVITRAGKGAFCAKEVVGNQHFLKGSVDMNATIKDFKEVEFVSDMESEYRDEFVINNERVKALALCNDNAAVYTWNKDYSKCLAKIDCSHCNFQLTEEVISSYHKTSDATCTSNELGRYEATFVNKVFEKQIIENIEKENTRHTDTLTKVEGKESTVIDKGYKDAYFCKECHKYCEDDDHQLIIGDESAYKLWINNQGTTPKQEHKIIKGETQEYVLGSNKPLVFASNGIYDYFSEVKVDGVTLDKGCYSSKSGSIMIELNGKYLNSLSTGKHSLCIVMDGVSDAETIFTIAKPKPHKDYTYIAPKTGIE